MAIFCATLAPAHLAGQLQAAAPGLTNLVISGNQVTATLDLQGIKAELSLGFEQVVGLTAANLGLSAQLISPNDPALLSRLPAGGQVTIPAAFPVLLRVQPPPAGGLSLGGTYTLGIHTYNLELTGACPLRLFAASSGGNFHDITADMGTGSYRVRGSRGTFSDFLIVADVRQLDAAIRQKFDAVNDLLDTYGGQLPEALLADLRHRLQEAQADYRGGSAVKAAQDAAAFGETVRANSGTSIPDVWRASGDLPNVAGQLRAAADTLRFSLGLVPSTPAAPIVPSP